MPSDRSLFLGATLLGFALAVPAWALAKGQWCNTEYIRHQAELTLVSATAGGRPIPLPEGVSFRLIAGGNDTIDAHVFCAGCEKKVRVYDMSRKP